MKVDLKSDHPVTDDACLKATGKKLKDWFAEIDLRGGPNQTRRDATTWLYDAMNKDAWWPTTVWVEYERIRKIVKKDGRIEGYNICVTKTVAAPVTKVFQAWCDSKQLKEWFGDGVTASVKDGGSLKDDTGNAGEFLRVRTDKDLRFSWNHPQAEAPTQVDVLFADKGGGKTGITLNHQRIQNRAEADGLRSAWAAAFDRLKSLLES